MAFHRFFSADSLKADSTVEDLPPATAFSIDDGYDGCILREFEPIEDYDVDFQSANQRGDSGPANAALFPVGQYFQLGSIEALFPNGHETGITISGWSKEDDSGIQAHIFRIQNEDSSYVVSACTNQARLLIAPWNYPDWVGQNHINQAIIEFAPRDQWNHHCLTYRPATKSWSYYVNGLDIGNSLEDDNFPAASPDFHVYVGMTHTIGLADIQLKESFTTLNEAKVQYESQALLYKLGAEASGVATQMDEIEDLVATKDAEINELLAQNAALNEEKEELQEAAERVAVLEEQLSGAASAELVDELNEQIATLNEKIDELNAEGGEVADLEAKIQELNSANDTLQQELAAAREQLAQFEELQEQLEELQTYKEQAAALPTMQRTLNRMSVEVAEADVEEIHEACTGPMFGTNDKKLIRVLLSRTRRQVELINAIYLKEHGKTLLKLIKSETSGKYKHLLIAALTQPPVLAAEQIKKACKGIGTDDRAMLEVLVTRSNDEKAEMRAYYERKYGSSMMDLITSETSGDFQKICCELLKGRRDEGKEADPEAAAELATRLYEAGPGRRFGTDEDTFINILCHASYDQIDAIKLSFEEQYNRSLAKTIKKEFRDPCERALLMVIKRPEEVYADLIHEAVAGLGTDEKLLGRVLGGVTRTMLQKVSWAYEAAYGEPLADRCSSELSGNFKKAVLQWLTPPSIEECDEDEIQALIQQAEPAEEEEAEE
jgi:annexin A7/11